ncbi:hypothetical protein [Silicimonas sp. MF1-12-2]|uniref:hypothetical protein n=1 Tax=Silicimonas sp. MF1-12-2 TaxID=3384793 RepID=UPI0039B55C4A
MIYGRAAGMTFEEACRSKVCRPKTGSIETLVLGAHSMDESDRRLLDLSSEPVSIAARSGLAAK